MNMMSLYHHQSLTSKSPILRTRMLIILIVGLTGVCILGLGHQQRSSSSVDKTGKSPLSLLETKAFQEHSYFAEEWRHPSPDRHSHCYAKGDDWTSCAGDHLLYRKAKQEDILRRPVLCLFEPLCWKQLDWIRTDPPEFECSLNHDHHFYDWSLHDGTMASLSTKIEKTIATYTQRSLNVYLCNNKLFQRHGAAAFWNYHYNFHQCFSHPTLFNTWATDASDQLGADYFKWTKSDKHAFTATAHLVAFLPTMFDFLMALNRTIIVNTLHRPNMYRCTYNTSQQSFRNLQLLASSGPTGKNSNGPLHIMAPGYVHDVEYMRHYTGIRPLYLPFSLLDILPIASYSGHKAFFLWNGHMEPPPELSSLFTFVVPQKYELKDLLQYRAVIVLPYSITNTKSLEQYEMNIPMFVPTPKFALELGCFADRTATYDPYCASSTFTNSDHPPGHPTSPYFKEFSPNARHVYGDNSADEEFWIRFSEVYLWPCVEYFASWEELQSKLLQTLELMLPPVATRDIYASTTNSSLESDTALLSALILKSNNTQGFLKMSQCMHQANKWRKYEADTNTCWALQRIEASNNESVSSPFNRSMAATYVDSLSQLYGVDHLFG
jgi:hypothetical protein